MQVPWLFRRVHGQEHLTQSLAAQRPVIVKMASPQPYFSAVMGSGTMDNAVSNQIDRQQMQNTVQQALDRTPGCVRAKALQWGRTLCGHTGYRAETVRALWHTSKVLPDELPLDLHPHPAICMSYPPPRTWTSFLSSDRPPGPCSCVVAGMLDLISQHCYLPMPLQPQLQGSILTEACPGHPVNGYWFCH
ncbi:hypothetical protein MG293_017515 [Ovis ammon polii]|uniref:Uncharacterized protein n=1 Tax=Ovis ammon polii TaxID=230172 RepID=A0AAD4TV56_OVIAM|nr:hypothetical protein MG293_017515 [Ovis ammon polii]